METIFIKEEPEALDDVSCNNEISSFNCIPNTSMIKGENDSFNTHDSFLIKQESLDTKQECLDKKQESLDTKQESIDTSSIYPDTFDKELLVDSNKVAANQKSLVIANGRNTKSFSCSICNESFMEVATLIIHIKRHNVEEINSCPICGLHVSGNIQHGSLAIHMWEHSGEEFSSYFAEHMRKDVSHSVSNESDRTFLTDNKNGLYVKKNIPYSSVYVAKGKQYPCSICNISFQQLSTLINHMEKHTGVNKKCCVVCGKRMVTNEALTKHMRTHTQEELQFMHNEDAVKKIFLCSNCGRHFQERDDFNNYMTWPHKAREKYKKNGIHYEDLKLCSTCIISQFTTTSREESYVQTPIADSMGKINNCPACPICGIKVQFISVLKAHMKSHRGKEFTKLGKMCRDKYRLTLHKNLVKKETLFICPYCVRKFEDIENFEDHVKTKHEKIKIKHEKTSHQCSICNKRFTQIAVLTNHMKSHTDKKETE